MLGLGFSLDPNLDWNLKLGFDGSLSVLSLNDLNRLGNLFDDLLGFNLGGLIDLGEDLGELRLHLLRNGCASELVVVENVGSDGNVFCFRLVVRGFRANSFSRNNRLELGRCSLRFIGGFVKVI